MGNKGLFPGVAVPLAFFCTLFFRHRKKSVSAPWDGKSQFAPESARQTPPGAGQGYAPAGALGAFRSPQAPSDRHPNNRAPHRAASPSLAPVSARQAPPRGIAYGKVVVYRCKQGAFRSPPCTPSGSRRIHRAGVCACRRTKGPSSGKNNRHGPRCRTLRLLLL